MTIQERVQQRIKEMRPMQVTKNGKMIGYLLDEEQYRDYCKVMLIESTNNLRKKAKKRGITQKEIDEILSNIS